MIQTLNVTLCQSSAWSPSPPGAPELRSLELPLESGKRLEFHEGGVEEMELV
jgi:hypothetical protein